MSGQGYEELIVLNRKIDELIDRYNVLKAENESLKKNNEAIRLSLQEKDKRLKDLEIKYDRLRLSGAFRGDGENSQEAKKKITELVREIDRCVAHLNR